MHQLLQHAVSCFIFQQVSDAIAYLLFQRTGKESCNYLDDFLHVAKTRENCQFMLDEFIKLCTEIGMPIAHEKTCLPTTALEFLGMGLDTKRQVITIPAEKRFKALTQLNQVIEAKKITVLQAQQLTGVLNFLGRAVVPGRAFTRRMYSKYANPKLKQHHHINVDREFRLDCITWEAFLGADLSVLRPFADFHSALVADELQWYTDSSKNELLGFGCYFQGRYAFASWNESEPDLIRTYNPSINFLELYAIAVSIELWCSRVKNRRVIIFSDNESAVHMINNGSSGCPNCMKLIRIITLTSLRNNTRFFLRHIPGKFNVLSDSLSRMDFKRFLRFAPKDNLRSQPEKLPPSIWPIRREWLCN